MNPEDYFTQFATAACDDTFSIYERWSVRQTFFAGMLATLALFADREESPQLKDMLALSKQLEKLLNEPAPVVQ